ncbi:unnamed protein product, partial [Symbiodinium microadriaticum]
EFCMTDLQLVFLKMDEECQFHLSQECRAHPRFEEYRAYTKSLGLEVFTYIDRVVADKASFLLWLDDCQKAKTTAETARARMVAHPLFPAFCEAIGVGVDQWGQDEANVAMELELFEEWVAAKDIEQRDPLKGLSEGTASFMDTMETQVDALWQLRACMVSPPPSTTTVPPPPPSAPAPPDVAYAGSEDVPRPPAEANATATADVKKQLEPEFESACGGEGDNNEREQMVLAATILRQDPSAFARAMQEDTQKPKEKDPRREIGQDTQKPKEKDPREEIRQDTQKPKEKDPQEIEQEGAKPKEKDPRQEIEQDTGKKPKQAYKYPLEAPPTEVIDKVHGLVSTAVPPRYEEQLGSKKRQAPAKKKADAAEQDEDDAEEPVDPEEVIQSMEAMCLEEARKEAQAMEKKAKKNNAKNSKAGTVEDERAAEDEWEDEVDEEEECEEWHEEKPKKAKTVKAKEAKHANKEDDEQPKAPKKKTKGKDNEPQKLPKKRKVEEEEAEDPPKVLKGKKKKQAEEADEDVVGSKGMKKKKGLELAEDEDEPVVLSKQKKKRKADMEQEDEEPKPTGSKGKKKKHAEEAEEATAAASKGSSKKKKGEEEKEATAEDGKSSVKKKPGPKEGKMMTKGPAKGLVRVARNVFRDCQGVTYQYNVPYEESEEEDPEHDSEVDSCSAKDAKKGATEGDHDEDQDYVMIVPPPHVKGNHIYSNAYKHALNNGLSLDDAKERARAATNDFRECGKVRKAWVGTFRARK